MSRRPRPLARPVRGHRCELITQAERYHRDVPPCARWCLSLEQFHGSRGWLRHTRYATDERARLWCNRVGIAYPGDQAAPPTAAAAVCPPPISCAHDPDYGDHVVPRRPLVDLRARAVGDVADEEPSP